MSEELRFYAPGFSLKVEGEELGPRGFICNQITVEQSVEASARLSFSVFRAGTEKDLALWLEEALSFFRLGCRVEARAGYGGTRLLIFRGCLTSISYSLSVDSIGEIHLEAQDFLFLLMKGRALSSRHRGGFSQVRDHEVVRQVVDLYPVFEEKVIQETESRHPKVQQKQEEFDYQFLKRLAERNGYLLYSRLNQEKEKAVFCFENPEDGHGRRHELLFGRELRSFTPQFDLSGMISRVVVRGWDPMRKKEIQGQAEIREGGATEEIRILWPSPPTLEVSLPVRDRQEARSRAQALLRKHRTLLQVEAECLGLPEIQAGDRVEIKGLPLVQGPGGTALEGAFLVTQATHQIGEGGYHLRMKLKRVQK
ncbi:MAG TPA: phage late control D family protein [Thermosulfurimonas dismutans]|uniref:Phage late control D family protein n=1 Tax=Thermosulfurimonas dismutans TaxID=999894 RepID=A0A7C3CJE7_9BACT|nr:phage late control D family protein [Thermosulfurimonas dismutans]